MPKTIAIRFRVDFAENSNIGPGEIDLLEAIDKLGSEEEQVRRRIRHLSVTARA